MIFENSNNAKLKFPKEYEEIKSAKLPERYILSACRFFREVPVSIGTLRHIILLWHKYVYLKDKSKDINKVKTYNELCNIVLRESSKYKITKQIFNDNKVVIGIIENVSDVRRKDVSNIWCIKSDEQLQKYLAKYNLYLIDNGKLTTESLFVLAIKIGTGEKTYWDLQDYKYTMSNCIKIEEEFNEKSIQFINKKLVQVAKDNKKDSFCNYNNLKSESLNNIDQKMLFENIINEISEIIQRRLGLK